MLFTHRVPRRLSAEVLLDAINQVTSTTESFVGQPAGARAIALPDPTIESHFLSTFGRPQRNNPCECARGSNTELSQALHLANSSALHDKILWGIPRGDRPRSRFGLHLKHVKGKRHCSRGAWSSQEFASCPSTSAVTILTIRTSSA
jgi:hypothetical protein